jgi:hypothetical protein
MVKDKYFLKTETKGKDNYFLALMEASYSVARTAGKWFINKDRMIRYNSSTSSG